MKSALLSTALLGVFILGAPAVESVPCNIESRFIKPPIEDRIAVFWNWSNATDKSAITRDLGEMAYAGIGRAVLSLTLAHSATMTNGTGTVFLSPQFFDLFRFALDEAARVGVKITAIPGNGWYQGGPWVTPEMGAQMLVWSEKEFCGPAQISEKLPLPDQHRNGSRARIAREAVNHLRVVATLAFRKTAADKLLADSMVNLTSSMRPDGTLAWTAPEGNWIIYRFGFVPTMVRMKQDSPGYGGLQIDHLSRAVMMRYLDEVAIPMLKAAGPHVGKTLDRFHEDSIELGYYDWTPDMPGQFKKRRGYDIVPLLPLFAGASFSAGPTMGCVEADFKETLEALLIDEHFGAFRDFCHQHGLTVVAESGETRSGIATKGAAVDHVMDEFWTHRGKDSDHPVCFNRNAVFASHVYGKIRNTAEAFTSHQHWMETPAQLKTLANEVYAMGLNHLTIHGFSSSRTDTPPPGDVYFAGTHYNPGVTWWRTFAPSLTSFFNRCQTMLTAGLPVSDLLYLDGPALQEMIKSNELLRETDRRFWKFDGIPGDVLAEAATVTADGRIRLTNGQTYAVLVVGDEIVGLNALRAVTRLVEAGATVWLQQTPKKSPFYADGREADQDICATAKRLGADRLPGLYSVGKGRVLTEVDRSHGAAVGSGSQTRTFYSGMHAGAMDRLGISPAFAYRAETPESRLFFFHRQAEGVVIYFVANALHQPISAECTFRVAGLRPERWDPVAGTVSSITEFIASASSTRLQLSLAANESVFIVFRTPASAKPTPVVTNTSAKKISVNGPWIVAFTPARAGLKLFEIRAINLFRWDLSDDERIRSFSGTASYRTQFEWKHDVQGLNPEIFLDIGESPTLYELTGAGGGGYDIRENVYDTLCAAVFVNGKSAGILWCAPYRLNISALLKSGVNDLEIRITNTWHNWRLANQFTAGSHPWEKKGLRLPSSPSGLLGPVTLQMKTEIPLKP